MCDSSGDWPLCVCLGNELSARARRRRSGARCWLDQELVRLVGVTHYRPAAAVSLAPDRHHRTLPNGAREDRSDACRRTGLRASVSTLIAISTCLGGRGRTVGCCAGEEARLPRAGVAIAAALCFAERACARAACCGRSRATGSYGAGLARFLAGRGELVLELSRSAAWRAPVARQRRPPRCGSHSAGSARERDAAHCHAAVSGSEALRLLLVARRSAVDVRREALVAAAQRDRDRAGAAPRRAAQAARRQAAQALQPPPPLERSARPTSSRRGSCCAASPAASRPQRSKPTSSNARSSPTSARSRPALLDEPGVGPIVAAQLIVAWSHPGRAPLRSLPSPASPASHPIPASSGQTNRHRLSRGGDRQLNRALHTVILHRRQHDPATRDYIARRVAEGKSTPRSHPPPQALPRPPPLPPHCEQQQPLMT